MFSSGRLPDLAGQQEFAHIPVLAGEVLEWLRPSIAGGGVLLDCTLGLGGHAEAMLREFQDLELVGMDRDRSALETAGRRLHGFGSRVRLVHGNFADAVLVLAEQGVERVEAMLFDLGVSSPQLDMASRGFSYRGGGPVDMRMDQADSLSAGDIVNQYSEDELARILRGYGEERYARRVARAIVRRRQVNPFVAAEDLAEVVRDAIPAAARRTGPHPARRTFQALRIETNRELESLTASLDMVPDVLAPGGRVAVISYHSLEDRIVKRAFREAAQGCICPREFPVCACGRVPRMQVLTRRPVVPSDEEVRSNRRSASARMRVAAKLAEEV